MKRESVSARARQFERRETAYEARIEPVPEHADQFHLGYPEAQAELAVIDVSEGGIGLRSGIFVPKNLRLVLYVSGVDSPQTGAGQTTKVKMVARRTAMIDHKPTYKVGLQFLDPKGVNEQAFLSAVRESKESSPGVEIVEGAVGS